MYKNGVESDRIFFWKFSRKRDGKIQKHYLKFSCTEFPLVGKIKESVVLYSIFLYILVYTKQ